MNAEESLALISYRLERSRESLRAAEIMVENSMFTFSMNRVYYAMFYAVQALLVSRKVSLRALKTVNNVISTEGRNLEISKIVKISRRECSSK